MPIKRLPSEITNEGSLSPAPNVVSKPTFILMTRLAFAEVINCWLDQGNNHQAIEGFRSAEEGEKSGREGMVVMDEGSSTCKFNGSEVPIEHDLSNEG